MRSHEVSTTLAVEEWLLLAVTQAVVRGMCVPLLMSNKWPSDKCQMKNDKYAPPLDCLEKRLYPLALDCLGDTVNGKYSN